MRDTHIRFELAIYYLPQPTKDPLSEVRAALQGQRVVFRQVEKLAEKEDQPSVAARMNANPRSDYAPPGFDTLQYFGRGLTREQAERLQNTGAALILDFAYSQEHVWSGLRAATELTGAVARATGGLIWDETTREVFSPAAWQEHRLDSWTEQFPEVANFTVVHAYKQDDGDFVRCVSLGMVKFGLPDIVIENTSWSLNRHMGMIIQLFSQTLVEGAAPTQAGVFDLDIRSIKNSQVREEQLAALIPKATGRAKLSLQQGAWEQGDPANRLLEITFDRGAGPDLHGKQEQVVSAAFGWEDAVAPVKHDEDLLAASHRARAKLPLLRAAFNRGLTPGEFIQVKSPFDTPGGGTEWMWVEVTSWQGDSIQGLLKNEPFNIPALHAGQMVRVSEAKVFDYLHHRADGSVDGNETGKLIQQRAP